MATYRFWLAFRSITERRIVGKPQILSRLRYVDIVKRCDETAEERAYRIQYESLQDWNNKYWAHNNELFNREKKSYIERHFGHEDAALSHDQLGQFYRDFLDLSRERHVEYNKAWYRNHIALLANSINAKLSRIRANLIGK